MPPPPDPHWSDNSREGNTTQSQSEGAVRGDRHCPLRKQVLYNMLKTQGFYKASFLSFLLSDTAKKPGYASPSLPAEGIITS